MWGIFFNSYFEKMVKKWAFFKGPPINDIFDIGTLLFMRLLKSTLRNIICMWKYVFWSMRMGVYHLSTKFVTKISIYDGLHEETIKSVHNEKLGIHQLWWVKWKLLRCMLCPWKGILHILYIIIQLSLDISTFSIAAMFRMIEWNFYIA